jgi:hypothetical protein
LFAHLLRMKDIDICRSVFRNVRGSFPCENKQPFTERKHETDVFVTKIISTYGIYVQVVWYRGTKQDYIIYETITERKYSSLKM